MRELPETSTARERRHPSADIVGLLSDGEFLRVWGGGTLLGIVRWLETLAVGIFVIDVTGSAATVALVGFARMLPMLLLGAVIGTLAGRLRWRTLLMVSVAVTGLSAATLATLAFSGSLAIWHIALGSFLTGVLWTADFPVRRTLIADIAGQERIGTAMALDSSTNHVTRLLGSALGGFLVGSVGLEGTYLLGTALYGIVFVLLAGLRLADNLAPADRIGVLADTLVGLRGITAERYLIAVLAVTAIFNMFGFAYTSMVPVIGRQSLHADAFSIGLLASTEALASLTAALLLATVGFRRHVSAIYVFGVLIFMIGILVFALSSNYWLSLAVMLMTGATWGGFSVTQSTLILLASPSNIRSRAMGVLAICIGLAPLGMLHLGWLAERLGASTAVAISAAEGVVAMILVMLFYPRILSRELPRHE